MSKNIKEIGKELLGKSLNSFHRKTGLTQLEKNNEMQDGILDGILSQVDDAYIEKTEQSNVIHLEGSGDGVVILDSIEGNTMVNIIKQNDYRIDNSVIYRQENSIRIKRNSSSSIHFAYLNINNMWKENTIYTMVYIVEKNTFTKQLELNNNTGAQFDPFLDNGFKNFIINGTGVFIDKLTTKPKSEWNSTPMLYCTLPDYDETNLDQYIDFKMIVLEGDWTNKEIPPYLEGLQSSFEEKVNGEGKYEIEILSKNKNLYNVEDVNIGSWMNSGGATVSKINNNIVLNGTISDYFDFRTVQSSWNANLTKLINKLPTGTTLTMSNNLTSEKNTINYWSVRRDGVIKYFTNTLTIQKGDTEIGGFVRFQNGTVLNNTILKVQIEVNNKATNYTISKQNKIKLLLNEPLRGTTAIKDKLVIKDSKLMIERNYREIIFNGTQRLTKSNNGDNTYMFAYMCQELKLRPNNKTYHAISDKLPYLSGNEDVPHIRANGSQPYGNVVIYINKSDIDNTTTNEYFKNNPIKAIFNTLEPYYEEVTNEYGEPIILEGYENGTLYIDSTVIPTTTVRYTPKMESFKTLKEVNKNNNLITLDINENIIPYMMDVDYMIMEKELCLLNTKNIRKMEVLDMTSMQKRTQDMLERLIKGKSLTEQECKTRVTTYLNAGKITDEQAEELMLLIDEVYA